MSAAARFKGTNPVVSGSDFWELTNFGTNDLDLTGYHFTDRLLEPKRFEPFERCIIASGESIVFVREDNTKDEAEFRNWWGACLGDDVQVRFYPPQPGFGFDLDSVQLWDPSTNLVDRVDFGLARRGSTFVYDPESGFFGVFSVPGTNGACMAVEADDVGSPGRTTGAVPLRIVQQPSSRTVNGCGFVEFSVVAKGFPRPKYQWFNNDTPILGATLPVLRRFVEPSDAGVYRVAVSNCLAAVFSDPATLAVTTNPSPPVVVQAPSDLVLFEAQMGEFTVGYGGWPCPTIQWKTNGIIMAGATNRTLIIPSAKTNLSGTVYEACVENSLGSTNLTARFTVTPVPDLRITEVMAFSSTNASCVEHGDFWELSNFGDFAVNLRGYRFADRQSLEGAWTNTCPVIIQPGESVIFTEGTQAEFIRWWGAASLPPYLQIVTFHGLGLSEISDDFFVWNAAEKDPFSPVTSVSFPSSFNGVSLWFDQVDSYCFSGCDSLEGEGGAFQAASCDDIGSPGWTPNTVVYSALTVPLWISRVPGAVELSWAASPGSSYRLLCADRLEPLPHQEWMVLGTYTAVGSNITEIEPVPTDAARYYMVQEYP